MYFILPLILLLGAAVGVLVNYLADVLPGQRRLARPLCSRCGQVLPWSDYLLLRSCPQCGQGVPWRSRLVIIFYILASLVMLFIPPDRLGIPGGLLLLTYLGLVVVIDIEHRLILHVVSLAGAVLGLGLGISLHGWQATLLGGLAGFLGMLALYFLGRGVIQLLGRVRHQPVEEEALGFGDVNLAGVVGLMLGWPGILAGIVVTIFLAGGISLVYLVWKIILKQYSPNLALPYGPFLALSALILLLF